mgnify:CR=1 FL=1
MSLWIRKRTFYAKLCFVNIYNVVLWYVMFCYHLQYYAMLCFVILCNGMLCYVMFCYYIRRCVILCYVLLLYTTLCYVMLCFVIIYDAVLCYVMFCYYIQRYVLLCYVLLYDVKKCMSSGSNVRFVRLLSYSRFNRCILSDQCWLNSGHTHRFPSHLSYLYTRLWDTFTFGEITSRE